MNHVLPEVPVWQPVHLGGPRAPADRSSHARQVEARAVELGLPRLRWPEPWPVDVHTAMLAAIFAQSAGRAVAFSLAAFRQAFAAGRDLGRVDNVLIAAAACELHPRAVLKAVASRAVSERLEAANAEAAGLGVTVSPSVVVGGRVHAGEEGLERLSREVEAPPGPPEGIR